METFHRRLRSSGQIDLHVGRQRNGRKKEPTGKKKKVTDCECYDKGRLVVDAGNRLLWHLGGGGDLMEESESWVDGRAELLKLGKCLGDISRRQGGAGGPRLTCLAARTSQSTEWLVRLTESLSEQGLPARDQSATPTVPLRRHRLA